MKNVFDGLIWRLDTAEERTSGLEDIAMETLTETPPTLNSKESKDGKKQNIQGLWDNYRKCNVRVMGVPEREERKKQKKHLEQP